MKNEANGLTIRSTFGIVPCIDNYLFEVRAGIDEGERVLPVVGAHQQLRLREPCRDGLVDPRDRGVCVSEPAVHRPGVVHRDAVATEVRTARLSR